MKYTSCDKSCDITCVHIMDQILSLFALLNLEIKIFTTKISKNGRLHGLRLRLYSSLTMSIRIDISTVYFKRNLNSKPVCKHEIERS